MHFFSFSFVHNKFKISAIFINYFQTTLLSAAQTHTLSYLYWPYKMCMLLFLSDTRHWHFPCKHIHICLHMYLIYTFSYIHLYSQKLLRKYMSKKCHKLFDHICSCAYIAYTYITTSANYLYLKNLSCFWLYVRQTGCLRNMLKFNVKNYSHAHRSLCISCPSAWAYVSYINSQSSHSVAFCS